MSHSLHNGLSSVIADLKTLTDGELRLLKYWINHPWTSNDWVNLLKDNGEVYSWDTLRRYRQSIYSKLGVRLRYQAVRLSRDAIKYLPPQPKGRFRSLSKREYEIFLRLADVHFSNLSVPKQAEQLNIAPATLKKHLQRIYRKLGVQTRASAATLAVLIKERGAAQ